MKKKLHKSVFSFKGPINSPASPHPEALAEDLALFLFFFKKRCSNDFSNQLQLNQPRSTLLACGSTYAEIIHSEQEWEWE